MREAGSVWEGSAERAYSRKEATRVASRLRESPKRRLTRSFIASGVFPCYMTFFQRVFMPEDEAGTHLDDLLDRCEVRSVERTEEEPERRAIVLVEALFDVEHERLDRHARALSTLNKTPFVVQKNGSEMGSCTNRFEKGQRRPTRAGM